MREKNTAMTATSELLKDSSVVGSGEGNSHNNTLSSVNVSNFKSVIKMIRPDGMAG